GFARARCRCGHDLLIAFSCKGRGVCPSCGTRRMAATAMRLVEDVLPPVPVRQFVLSVPKRLRFFLHRDPVLAGTVLRIVLRAVESELRGHCPGAPAGARTGAVSFIQRFGGSLNAHLHYHCCVIDGVFALHSTEGGPAATLRFHPADPLDQATMDRLQELLRRRILKHFQRQGLLEADDVETMLGWAHGGFSLDASARVQAWDRDGLERLLRYCGRPPLAGDRARARAARLGRGRRRESGLHT
ncbi:MAG: transposase, partial [Rhodobacteraceae bacterium]|nr:transposase [Paracoccaceae bacterium]